MHALLWMPDWWTESNAAWAEAIALVFIFLLELALGYLELENHRADRQERREARHERRQAEIARQRSEVTCDGVTSVLRSLSEPEMCKNLWAGHFRHAGFAFEKTLFRQLPEYLRRKCEPFTKEIDAPIGSIEHQRARFLLVFRFPYPTYEAVLEDVDRLNFGNIHLVWDENGEPIPVRRD
jgi:hypothetical protein